MSRSLDPILRPLTPLLLALGVGAVLLTVDPSAFNPFRDTKEHFFLYTGGLLGFVLALRLISDPQARRAGWFLIPLLPLFAIATWRGWQSLDPSVGLAGFLDTPLGAYQWRIYSSGLAACFFFWLAASDPLTTRRGVLFGRFFLVLALVQAAGVGIEILGETLGREWRIFVGSASIEVGAEETKTAFFGSLGNSNFLAGHLAILFFAALPSLSYIRRPTKPYGGFASVPWIVLFGVLSIILACRSKGALLALVLGGIVYTLGKGRLREPSPPQSRRFTGWKAALAAGGFALLLVVVIGGAFREDWRSTLSLRGESLSKRVFLAYTGLHLFKESPLLGVGPGEFRLRFLDALSEILASENGEAFRSRVENLKSFKPVHLHNDPIELLVEWGIVGYGSGLLFLTIVLLQSLRRMRFDSPEAARMRLAALSGFAAAVGYSLFEFPFHLPPHLSLAAVLLGLSAAPSAGGLRRSFSIFGLLAGIVVALLAVLLVLQGLRLCAASHLAQAAWTSPKSKVSEVNLAYDQIRRASVLDPGSSEIGLMLGQFQWRIQKRPGDAVNTLRRYEVISDDPLFTILQAQIALEDRRFQDALRAISPLAGIADFLPGVGGIQGQIARELSRPEEAAEAFLRDIRATARFPNPERINPDLPGLYLRYGDVLEALGKYREAVWQYEAYNRLIAERGSSIPVGFLRLGQIYRDRFSDLETARTYFQKALESAEKHSTSAEIQVIREEIRRLNELIRQIRTQPPPAEVLNEKAEEK